MSWDFETEPAFQAKLDWIDDFVAREVEPLDHVFPDPYDRRDAEARAVVRPLQEQVKAQGLWACHLGPELGGPGYGQVKLALMNEYLGRANWGPTVFGCQAPDSGNGEILAHYGTPELQRRYLEPLLSGEITSCYSMTEPHGGADPTLFTTAARRDGDEWVINGEKWFSSNAKNAEFFVVMAVTNPDVSAYKGMSMFVVPAGTPGLHTLRLIGEGTEPPGHGSHGYMRYEDVRVPADHLIGAEGLGFEIAQTRLGGGRIHHAMRTIAQTKKALDMMCERAVSRTVRDGPLGSLQMTQERIADSWIELQQFRLLVLYTAWMIDKHHDYRKVRKEIAAVKVAMPTVLQNVVRRSLHLHGAIGISNEMPFAHMMVAAEVLGIADGPSEVHKLTIARQLLKDTAPAPGMYPTGHLPTLREAARGKYAEQLEHLVGNL